MSPGPAASPSPASDTPHDVTYRVVYRDTDQMGFMYHANHFVLMEIGRVELLRAKGWSYREMEAEGILIPVLHAECDFKRPALYDDIVRIRTWMELVTRVRVRFRYELHCDARGELLSTGMTEHAFMGGDRRPVRLDPKVVERLAAPVGTP